VALQQAEARTPALSWPPTPARREWAALGLRRSYDLLGLVGLALALPALVLLPLPELRLPLGLALVLLAPGYALAAALFAGRDDLDGVTRAALSCGLSGAVLPVLVLLLHALSSLTQGVRPLQPLPIALSLSAWILVCSGVALWRRLALAPQAQAYLPWGSDRLMPLLPRGRGWAVAGALALTGSLAACGIGLIMPDRSARLTEFYMLGPGGLAEDFPRTAAVGDELSATVGIANRERRQRTYRVEVWADDPESQSRRTRVALGDAIALEPGQTREERITWRMPWPGNDQRVELWLVSGDGPQPYRRLRLWLQVSPQLVVQDPQ
jgi:uncharacterized membrane protein